MSKGIPAMFDEIAKRYDLINDLLSFGIHRTWLKKAIRKLHIENGFRILDLATGTGNFVFEFLSKYPNLDIVGIDLAEKMLDIARERNSKQFNNKAKFLFGDATRIPFADNTFDIVSISYGIRNVQDVQKCLFEIQRVLKPNGQLIIVEFGQPSKWILPIYKAYQKIFIRYFGGVMSRNRPAYRYFVNSINKFPYGKDFLKILKELDLFHSLAYYPLNFGIAYIYIGKAKK
ncbi:MAG: bifunctional demethylmenaquinone methyltransferase/2-methoxy-6-polyprenyl-1,4-benzoquinol methylase UbiE [Candidatus Kapaibacteriota bacterium]